MQFLFSTLLSFLDLVWNRWAVSSVMTRQNQIPTEDGRRVTLALIPLWDMCNHRNGLVRLQHTLTLWHAPMSSPDRVRIRLSSRCHGKHNVKQGRAAHTQPTSHHTRHVPHVLSKHVTSIRDFE